MIDLLEGRNPKITRLIGKLKFMESSSLKDLMRDYLLQNHFNVYQECSIEQVNERINEYSDQEIKEILLDLLQSVQDINDISLTALK